MRQAVIIVNAYSQSEEAAYQPKRIKEELEKLGVKTDIKRLGFADCFIDGGDISTKFGKYDFCVFYDKDSHALAQIEKSGLRCFNSYDSIVDCDDKMLTYVRLANEGVPMPKTYSAPLCYTPGSRADRKQLGEISESLGFPLIVKECYGSLGKGVSLVNDAESLYKISDKLIASPHIFQEFIAESRGTDLRVIVVGGKFLGAMRRVSDGDFRSNIGVGGKGEIYLADERTKELAEKIAKTLKLDYCGIDFLFSSCGPILCEVNSNAFFKGFEFVTGINVAEAYAKYICETVYGKE